MDIDGDNRVADGDSDGTAVVDMGADEYAVQDIAVIPLSIDFSNSGGDTSQTRTSSSDEIVTITNEGSANLHITNITITGNDASDFNLNLSGGPDPVENIPLIVPAGMSKTFTVSFNPASEGTKNASIVITSNDPDEGIVTIILSGGAAPPDISVDPESIDFGEVKKNKSSSAEIVTIENQGGDDLIITEIKITGENADAFSFKVVGDQCSTESVNYKKNGEDEKNEGNENLPMTISSGDNAIIKVKFSPKSEGDMTASLEMVSNDPDEEVAIVKLTGNGTQGSCILSSSRDKRGRKKRR